MSSLPQRAVHEPPWRANVLLVPGMSGTQGDSCSAMLGWPSMTMKRLTLVRRAEGVSPEHFADRWHERALELLAERRGKGPPQKRAGAKRSTAKRAPAKRKKPS